jgi:hypothetical protein
MTARQRLPNRRASESFGFECAGLKYTATASWFADGRLGEGIPASSVEAFKYILRQNDPERLRAWLATRSAEEQTTFKNMLAAK